MKKNALIIFCLLLNMNMFSQTLKDSVTDKNHIYLSVGAPSIYAGISYERQIFQKGKLILMSDLGLGLNIFNPSFGKEFNIQTGVTTLFGNGKHKAEFGLGLIHYFLNQSDLVTELNFYSYKPILYGLVGYRYQFENIPFGLKIGITPIFVLNKDKLTFFPLAEIGVGYRF